MRIKRTVLPALLITAAIACAAPPESTQDRARRIEEKLIAPCCWSESVAVHRSETAAQMRTAIASQLAAGRSEKEILDAFIAQHGEKILLEPRGSKWHWLVWTPLSALLLGGLWLGRFLSSKKAPEPAAESPAITPVVRDEDLDW